MTTDKDITLGEFLRHERERRGITIEQVASATKVGVKTLHSLEADHFSELPAKPFIRGFVTSYCRFIGLDPKEVLSRFEDYIQLKSVERPNREGGHSGYVFERKDGEQQSRTTLLIAIFSFIVVGGLAVLFLKPSLRHHRNSHIDKLRAAHGDVAAAAQLPSPLPSMVVTSQAILPVVSPSPLAPQDKDSANNSAKDAAKEMGDDEVRNVETAELSKQEPLQDMIQGVGGVPSPSPSLVGGLENPGKPGLNPADPLDSGLSLAASEIHHKVVFKVLADIWVRYQVDQRPVRKFIVRKGKSLILRGLNSIRIQVSNPNAAKFHYNGKENGLVGESKNLVMKRGVGTLFFPHELAEKIENPFKDDKPLPVTPDPLPESKSPITSPSP